MSILKYCCISVCITGLILFFYGVCNIPNSYPGQEDDANSGTNVSEINSSLNSYRIHSLAFTLLCSGIGVFIVGLVLFILHNRHQVRILPM